MAFNDYIVLDGYRYKTLAKQWKPAIIRPASARMTLAGALEGTFGPNYMRRWEGMIIAAHGESAPGTGNGTYYGNIYTLRNTLTNQYPLSLQDHYGNYYSVIAQGPFDETSLVNVWNSTSNKYYVHVVLTGQ